MSVFAGCHHIPRGNSLVSVAERFEQQKNDNGDGSHIHAPDFTLKNIYGGKDITLSDYSGKVVIIDFWATWCRPCQDAVKSINELYENYHADGLEVIGISIDRNKNAKDLDKVKAFVERKGIKYPVGSSTYELLTEYGISAIPFAILLDKNGDVIKLFRGYSVPAEAVMEREVKRLLSK